MQNSLSLLNSIFLQEGFISLSYKIISFIDIQTLSQIIDNKSQNIVKTQCKKYETEKVQKIEKKRNKMKQIIQIHIYLKQYLNKTDRSMYYSFYDQPQFIEISNQLQNNIVIIESKHSNHNKTHFSQLYQNINSLFKQINRNQILNNQQLNQLKRIITDPSLPLPAIKRQNQGMYCNSSFQLFLVGLRFPHYGHDQYTPFEQLKLKIQEQQDLNFKQFLQIQKQKHSNMKTYQNLHLVRYMPYQITSKNYHQLLLPNNSQHNIIVFIFAITDIWIQSIFSLINLIDDPFYKFIEIMSRYSAFRSFVIELQESLGFLFHSYQNLYSDTIRDSIFLSTNKKPKYCFWRPALTKWFVKMNSIHVQTNKVYFMLLSKLRQQMLLQKLGQQYVPVYNEQGYKSLKKYSICLRNSLQINQLSLDMKHNIYLKMTGSSLIQQFIIHNKDTCQALIFQYVEYIIDLAVNQQTVHWCGHSRHRLEKPFNIFNSEFKQYNEKYLNNLKEKVLCDIGQKQVKNKILQILIQCDIQFLQNKNVKSVMLRQLVQQINHNHKFFSDQSYIIQHINNYQNNQQNNYQNNHVNNYQNNYQDSKSINQQNNNINVQNNDINEQDNNINVQKNNKNVNKQRLIFYDFVQRDQKLRYFNQKAKICQSIEGQEKCFFSIPPLLSPQQILTKSINTNDSSQNQDQNANSSFQYVSDNQQQQYLKQTQQKQFIDKHQFIDKQQKQQKQNNSLQGIYSIEMSQINIKQKRQLSILFNIPYKKQNHKQIQNGLQIEQYNQKKRVVFITPLQEQNNNNLDDIYNNNDSNNYSSMQNSCQQQLKSEKKTLHSTNSSVKTNKTLLITNNNTDQLQQQQREQNNNNNKEKSSKQYESQKKQKYKQKFLFNNNTNSLINNNNYLINSNKQQQVPCILISKSQSI